MKKYVLGLAGASFALTGCFGPGEPVVLPDDTIEAARTCFVAQGMTLREDKSEGDAVTYSELVESMKYALAAAAQTDPFTPDTVGLVLEDSSAVIEDLSSMDYAGAVPTCDARFGMDEPVSLPEDQADAVLSCLSLAAFLKGAAEAQSAEFGEAGAEIGSLFERLEAMLETDADVLVRLIGTEGDDVMLGATQIAFGAGSPREYIEQCTARFPAE